MSTINILQAQAIVDKHFVDIHPTIAAISKVAHGYSFTPCLTSYILDLALGESAEATHSSFLVVSADPDASTLPPFTPNSLSAFPMLLETIRAHTSIPIPSPIVDDTRTLIPFAYLITPAYPIVSTNLVSLAQARAAKVLTPHQLALIDLQLGQYLGELHKGAQNDWFGLPSASTQSFDWQETFIGLLESLMDALAIKRADLPIADLRAYLARAISAFLFSDVEVPSLVWFTGGPDDVFLAFTSSGDFSTFAILPAVAHAHWGDPLSETFFLDASPAFWEGYKATRGEEDSAIMVFPRQRTKRIWYNVFLALVVLQERDGVGDEKTTWAEQCLRDSAHSLKDAPCS
ncbi:hypothetical protein MIND_00608700 [Mycena indigotica]|uniref:Aminoglycoside phosphotransferase domain-containing protein n=1 Tax=Mycena indigotica TaxID=2126181 RepID=A0A8H6STS3_9AGAR|nr:uncharacterized protein MIND_00608700 [Mycena indigotica]KAF7303790.1 hypothetical protein MIND_00608700 [Mycena indigotica]